MGTGAGRRVGVQFAPPVDVRADARVHADNAAYDRIRLGLRVQCATGVDDTALARARARPCARARANARPPTCARADPGRQPDS